MPTEPTPGRCECCCLLNGKPTFTSTPPGNATVGVKYTYKPVISNLPEEEPLELDVDVGPAAMEVVGDQFEWTPGPGDVGFIPVTFLVTDGCWDTTQSTDILVLN